MCTSLFAAILVIPMLFVLSAPMVASAAPPAAPAAKSSAGGQSQAGPAARDPSTCAEAWRGAKASGATESKAAYVKRCEKGQSEVAGKTSFPGAARSDLSAPAPAPPTASGKVPGPMPPGATALCKDGSYSTAPRHADACVGSGGVLQFFK